MIIRKWGLPIVAFCLLATLLFTASGGTPLQAANGLSAAPSRPDAATAAAGSGDNAYTASNQPAGTYYYRVKANLSSGDSDWSNSQTVTVSSSGQNGIYGRVTYQGNAIGGIYLVLRSCLTATQTCTDQDIKPTQPDGTYQFVGAPGLASGAVYHVMYLNGSNGNTDNSNYLGAWVTADFSSYSAGATVAAGDFDIADVPLVAPAAGAQVALPYTFQWTPRAASPTDNYVLELFDTMGLHVWWTNPYLGYVDHYALPSLPPGGFTTGVVYLWAIVVYGPDGSSSGVTHGARPVIFTSSGLGNQLREVPVSHSPTCAGKEAANDNLEARLRCWRPAAARLSSATASTAPTLYPIANAGGGGTYTVTWSAVSYARGYTLEEATAGDFANARVVYQSVLPPVELSPGYSQTAKPGTVVSYTHVLTNTGDMTDTFKIQAANSRGWAVTLASRDWPTGTLELPLSEVGPSITRTFVVSLTVPGDAAADSSAATALTATSLTTPTVYAAITDTLTVKSPWTYLYLPQLMQYWPPVPDTPGLRAISNAGTGNYDVAWNATARASTYTLQEAADAAFTNPIVQYSGIDTSWSASGKSGGTYYYRVKASNAWGDSGWSNTQSVVVASPGWSGTTSHGMAMSFNVSAGNTQWSKFTLGIAFSGCGGSGTAAIGIDGPGTITNNAFSYSTSTQSFAGSFSDAHHAGGTYAFNKYKMPVSLPNPPFICYVYVTESGTWSATKP